MFGANKQEGVLVLSCKLKTFKNKNCNLFNCIFNLLDTYLDFLVPNNLVEDSEFLANDLIPTLVKGLRKCCKI